jgi:hypothetical protein
MAAVNCLYVAAASTAASAAALQWWASSLLDGEAGAGGDGDGDWLEAVLRSRVTVALLANLAAHAFLVVLLALKVGFRCSSSIWACFAVAARAQLVLFRASNEGDWIVVV